MKFIRRTIAVSSVSLGALGLATLPLQGACGSATSNTPADGGPGATGTPDTGAGGDATGGTGGGGGANACGLTGEVVPNETRDMATPYTFGTAVVGCVDSSMDHDFYEFTAPAADLAGGYIQISLTEVGDGQIDMEVYAASDNGSILRQYATSRGMSVLGWLALAPGQTYRVAIRDFAGFTAPYKYTLRATYTKVADTYEPNNTKDTAKPLTSPVAIDAFLYAGLRSGSLTMTDYDDWYSVTLATGTATTKLENVPTDLYGDLEIYDSAGKSLDRKYSATLTKGASLTSTTAVVAGSYFIRAGVFTAQPDGTGTGPTAPDHFTRAYHLSVAVAP